MNRMEEFRAQMAARMAALRAGDSVFAGSAGCSAAERENAQAQAVAYLTPTPEEFAQWIDAVRSSPHVRMNASYGESAAKVQFGYLYDDDQINAFAARAEQGDGYRIVFYGGAIRFSRLASLAVAVDMCGRPGTASRFAKSIDTGGKMSRKMALELMSDCGLDEAFSIPGVRTKAQAVSAGMIIGILAHEMGHVCLGHVMGPNYYKMNQEIGRNHEREADSFASSITAATPFGEYVYEGMLFWHYVLAQQQGNEAVESSHPLERERLENLIRANSSKASALGIRLPG